MHGRSVIVVIGTIVLVTGALGSIGRAQASGQAESIMPALLTEVRGLRAAMEKMATAGARVQLALGRLQLQEERLNTSIGRLDEVRARLADTQRAATEQQEQLAVLESELKNPSPAGISPVGSGHVPPGERPSPEQVEEMLRHQKRLVARIATDVTRLAAEEATLATDVASEQARWSDLNQKLEALERALGAR